MPSFCCPPPPFKNLPLQPPLSHVMADFTAPSFSLGLDSDQEEETQALPGQAAAAPIDISYQSPKKDDEEGGNFNAEGLHPDPRPALKRLRRGPPPPSSGIRERESPKRPSNADDDEEIEEFSSQEDPQKEEGFYTQNRSACCSSKISLQSRRVLTTQSANTSNARKKKPTETVSISASIEASSNKGIFPSLTISPLRKFQLLDSDTDEPSSEIKNESTKKAEAFAKDNFFTPQKSIAETQNKGAKCSFGVPQAESLWKDFSPMKNNKMETPALDEFCEEFFRSMKDSNARNSTGGDTRASCPNAFLDGTKHCFPNSDNGESAKKSRKKHDNSLPAYQYFYHNDPRIRKLVQDRLPHFFPIGTVNQEGQLDYMSQFGQTDVSVKASVQPHGTGNLEGSSRKRKKNLNGASAQEFSQASGSWMNPKSTTTIPRDAGKRRVRADVSTAGHWYTSPDGRKVYVSKNGQELAGRMAYRQYRKESGRGFKKSRRKATGKKNSKK